MKQAEHVSTPSTGAGNTPEHARHVKQANTSFSRLAVRLVKRFNKDKKWS